MHSLILAGSNFLSDASNDRYMQLGDQIKALCDFSKVVVLASDIPTPQFVKNFEDVVFYQIPPKTAGALATAAYGLSKIPRGESFVVVPANSFIKNDGINRFQENMSRRAVDVGAIVFEGRDPIFSFARVDSEGDISEIIEKEISGSCALAGVYYFRSTILLSKCIEWAMVNNVNHEGNFYISPALNYFLANSIPISLYKIPPQDYLRH